MLRSIALRAMTGLWSPCAQRFHDGVDFLRGDLPWDGGFGPKGDAFGSRNEMEWMDRRIQNHIYIYMYIYIRPGRLVRRRRERQFSSGQPRYFGLIVTKR